HPSAAGAGFGYFFQRHSPPHPARPLGPLLAAGPGVALHHEERVVPMAEFIDVKRLADEVRQRLSPERFAHVQGVVEAAARLARRWRAPEHKAVVAAWLHDVAKELPPATLLKLAGD